MSCFSCKKSEPSHVEFEIICSDCCVSMCEDCKDDDENMCGCYGTCDQCDCSVNRGEDGWRCMDCQEWLCNDCKIKSGCSKCGQGEDENEDEDRYAGKIIETTFKHINDNWKKEDYQKCALEWKQIQLFMSKEETPFKCGDCDTYWTSVQYINDHEIICPKCDTYCNPMLCNPVNWLSVLDYIDPKFHHYLIPNLHNIDTISFLEHIKCDIKGRIGLIGDDFTAFLDGLTLKRIHFEYIGFYEEKNKNAYIYTKSNDPIHHNIIHNAWELLNDDDVFVSIYGSFNGNYRERNDYEPDRKYLYKYLMNVLVDKVFE